MPLSLPPNITFRPVADDDGEFLLRLYTETHGRVLASAGDDPQIQSLVQMQCTIQQQQYAAYPDADLMIILRNGEPIGRWYVQRKPEEFAVIDIAILPEYQQAGLGRAIMGDFLAEAGQRDLCVRAHAEKLGRAWLLWERMGFRVVGDDGVYLEILWSPDDRKSPEK